MTTQKPGTGGLFDDMSRLMSNAMGVAQGARDEAETAMKGWVDRWLADRNLVTREEFEVVREMAIRARAENAELRAMIAGMSGQGGRSEDEAPHVSEAEAPATDMNPPNVGDVNKGDAPHVSEAEAPATDMNPPNIGNVNRN